MRMDVLLVSGWFGVAACGSSPGAPSHAIVDSGDDGAGAPDASVVDSQPTANGEPAEAALAPTRDSAPLGDATADPSALCPDIQITVSRCYRPACAQATVAECPTVLAPVFSQAYAQALHACAATESCLDWFDASGSCMSPKIRSEVPTPAQEMLANDFCPACAQAPATRDGGLSCVGHVFTLTSTGLLLASKLLELSDASIARVYAARCIAMATQQYPNNYDNCESVFLNCVQNTLPGAPAACAADAGM